MLQRMEPGRTGVACVLMRASVLRASCQSVRPLLGPGPGATCVRSLSMVSKRVAVGPASSLDARQGLVEAALRERSANERTGLQPMGLSCCDKRFQQVSENVLNKFADTFMRLKMK
eukprot:g71282.t1